MDFSLVIRHRLEGLGLEQRDLAIAAQVTESYISQLLTRKKAPPAPDRTDIYEKIERFLKLPIGELTKLAVMQRQEELKRKLADQPTPLYKEIRELVLRKCKPDKEKQIRALFEKQPLRVTILEFLDTDVFNVSVENCVSFVDPLIESWDIDIATFGMEIVLNHRVAPGRPKRFEFVERDLDPLFKEEPGLKEFLNDTSLSGDATEEEIEFLKKLRFKGKRPTSLYYYRELQNLRDPLHFRAEREPLPAGRS